MSGTVTMRAGSSVTRTTTDPMDTTVETYPAHEAVADEGAIEGTNRLLIEAVPSLDVPTELRAIAVPSCKGVDYLGQMLCRIEALFIFFYQSTDNT